MEIKLRAWHREKKLMLNVYCVDQTLKNGVEYYETCKGWYGNNGQLKFKYDAVEWLQFTGLIDKNGDEIYEGDILKLDAEFEADPELFEENDGNPICHKGFFKVFYNNGIAGFDIEYISSETGTKNWSLFDESAEDMEVVGNIYEDHKLFK